MSTAGPDVLTELEPAVIASGSRLVAAPIMGSPSMVVIGKGTLLPDGDIASVEDVRPILEHLGTVRSVGRARVAAGRRYRPRRRECLPAGVHRPPHCAVQCAGARSGPGLASDRTGGRARSGACLGSTGARSPGTTPSGSTGRSSSCRVMRPGPPTTPASWSRSMSVWTARSWPSTASVAWRRRSRPPIPASCAPALISGSTRASARPGRSSPGSHRPIIPGSGYAPTASSPSG
ncbi:MAG: NAD(P)-dependent oxidoreductase [Chloroflexi bacterium]|nr:NAD(P)-dependent oxidoreductase [Chloroflexota bacterium]